MRHLFIINPTAGRGNLQNDWGNCIRQEAQKRGLDYELLVTARKGEAEEAVRLRAQDPTPLRVYVLGGDGTLNEVVNGGAGHDHVAVTALPLGSGNDFLKIFGEDQWQFLSIPTLLDHTNEVALDLIECNGRLALNVCSLGLDARIGLGMSNWKKYPFIHGNATYVLSAVSEILQGIAKPMTITVPGEEPVCASYTLVCVCNGRAYGGVFHPYPAAMPDDGVLHFILVPKLSLAKVAQLISHYAAGEVDRYGAIARLYHGTGLTIQTPTPYRMQLDGEELVDTHFSIRLSPKKLRFFYPKTASYASPAASANAGTSHETAPV
jgi:YegS/Rv2252/BmrU family lipid kinase